MVKRVTEMTELIPRLYIGNWHDARDNMGIMHIVTVASDSPVTGNVKFDLVDGPGNLLSTFADAVEAVCRAHESGEKVLVHCVGGRSRSAAVIVVAATKITGRPFCEIYDDLLRKHDGSGTGARIHPYLSILMLEALK